MQRNGRITYLNVMLGAVIIGVIAIFVLLLGSRSSPTSEASKFLNALASANTNELVQLSYFPGDSTEDLRKQWDFAVNDAGKYYVFTWMPTDEKFASDTQATVKIKIVKNADKYGSYGEDTSIPMIKRNGQWLVDVRSLDKSIYPDLPH